MIHYPTPAMISVLHVFDGSQDGEDRRTRERLVAYPPVDVRCTSLRFGPAAPARDAAAAAVGVRRRADDVVHAWGSAALGAAVLGGARSILYSPTHTSRASLRVLRLLTRWRGVHVVSRTTAEQAMLRAAAPLAQCSVIRAAVESVCTQAAADVRRSIGLKADDIALLAVGESTRAADHAAAVWAAGILNVLDPRFKVLLWGRGPLASAAVKLAGKLRQRDMVVVAERRGESGVAWESLVAAADVALLTAAGPVATWPVAACMAAGLPVVSTIERTTSDFVTPHTALLATDRSPRTLARGVLDVRENAPAAAARVAAGKAVAGELFSIDRLRSAYGALYARVAGCSSLDSTAPSGRRPADT